MSEISLATLGDYSGRSGVADATPPTIAVVSPTPSTEPGEPGGFAADFTVAKATPIILQVLDVSLALTFASITMNGETELAFRTDSFLGTYIPLSSWIPIAGGIQVTFLPQALWPEDSVDRTKPCFITLVVDAVDLGGNVTTGTFVFELPPAALARVASTPAVVGVDHVQAALARIVSQFRE